MTEEKDIYKELPSEDDDVLLEQLGRFARRLEAEEEDLDERLLRLQEGTLGEDEHAEWLEQMTEQERLDYEAFRPLGSEFKGRVLSQLKAERAERGSRQDRTEPTQGNELNPSNEPGNGPGSGEMPLPFRQRRFPHRPLLALAASVLLAVVGLWLMPGVFDRGTTSGPLPDYAVSFSESRSEDRSLETEKRSSPVPELLLGDRFRLTLRPEHDIGPGVETVFLLADAEGVLRPWLSQSDYERSSSGSIRVDGVLGDLGQGFEIEPGAYSLVFLYGQEGSLPEPSTLSELRQWAQEMRDFESPPAWRYLAVPFQVALPPLASDGLEVLYSGCFELRVTGLGEAFCVPHRNLTVWVRGAPGKALELLLDGESIRDTGVPIDGGRRFSVPMAADDTGLLSRLLEVRSGQITGFELHLRPMQEPEWLTAARRQGVGGEVEEARRLLVSRLEDGPTGRIQSLLARLPGTPESERREWLDKAFAEHRSSGSLEAMSQDFGMLAYLDFSSRSFTTLRQRLESLGAYERQLSAEGLFRYFYYRGLLENDLGNARGALLAIGDAIQVAERTGLEADLARATGEKALLLQRLGRGQEASEIFANMKTAAFASPCERGRWLNNHAWSVLFADGELGDPLPLLEEGLELVEENECDDRLRLNLDLNRALAHALAGRTFEAEVALAEVRESASGSALHDLWRLDIEGRLQMAAGRYDDAILLYRELEESAEIAIEPLARWHARVQRAEAFDALGDLEKALAELEGAEAIVDAAGLEVPIGAGRDHFLADRELSAQRRLDLLLRMGREEEAFTVARRSRVRALQTLRQGHRLAHLDTEQQMSWDLQIGRYLGLRSKIEKNAAEHWKLSQETGRDAEGRLEEDRRLALAALDRAYRVLAWRPGELPALKDDECVLLFHPLEEGWVGFGAGAGEIVSHRIELAISDLDDPARLSERLLGPFSSLIDSSPRLRILPHGELREVDFHALPWRESVLLAAVPVTYGLDLEPAGVGAGEGALILSDPRGDLPAARQEASAVAAALSSGEGRSRGEVTRLAGEQATLPEVLLRLPGVALLHVAGHGQTEGEFAWQSSILLAAEGRLAVGDILTLENAPSDVVLSSCESARATGTKGSGLGLAQSFLIAGSSRVVASTRPVGDAASSELFRLFYELPGDVAERLRQAQLAWRVADPSADWASYRLLVP